MLCLFIQMKLKKKNNACMPTYQSAIWVTPHASKELLLSSDSSAVELRVGNRKVSDSWFDSLTGMRRCVHGKDTYASLWGQAVYPLWWPKG